MRPGARISLPSTAPVLTWASQCLHLKLSDTNSVFQSKSVTHQVGQLDCFDFSEVTFLKFYLFIYVCAGSSLLFRLFSSHGKQGPLSSCDAQASRCLCCCVVRALGCVGSVVWPAGLVALQPVESSWIRDQIHVSCIGR